jgi:sigma-B regulation protein RsbU (phosphoserine phosphatase)
LGITANANFEKKEITLSQGESILLYSDGLIEAENEEQEFYGNERLIRYAKDKKDRHIGEGLLDEIRKWRGNATINDDLTMLEIWRD